MTQCPTSRDGLHHYTYSVGKGTQTEYEPTEFGESAADTVYRAVQYSLLACSCGIVKKAKLVQEDA